MSLRKNKMLSTLAVLSQATLKDQIKWKSVAPPEALVKGTDDVVPICYQGEHKSYQFLVFERRTQVYSMEFDQFYWSEFLVFSLLGDDGKPVYEYSERSSALKNLYRAIKEQVSGVNDFMDVLLDDFNEDFSK